MKKNKINIIDIIFAVIISFLVGDIARKISELPRYAWVSIGIVCAIFLICLLIYLGKNPVTKKHKFAFSIFPLFVVYFCFWYQKLFGDVDVGALMFHFEAGLEGAATEAALFREASRYFLLFVLMSVSLVYFINRFRVIEIADRLLALPIFLVTPFATHLMGTLYYSQHHAVMPALFQDVDRNIKLSASPKNVILIYAESGERTYQHLENGKAVYAPMIDIASQGMEIVGVEQVTNTGWTVAGLIASQCGTSLQPIGLLSENNFAQRKEFLPGVTCLSDVLAANGYTNEFVYGGDLAFAGTDKFMSQHNYNKSDIYPVHRDKVGDYLNSWGLYDDTLFGAALEKTHELHKNEKPFLLTVLTIGGHSSKGYPSQSCHSDLVPASDKSILFSVQCMGHHIKQFIGELEKTNLLDNTLVVVMSDHLVMQTEVTSQLKKHNRLNFLAFIGSGVDVSVRNKQSATFDTYPTILELLGFNLPERRAGLGVSLLSDQPTLVEQFGTGQLNSMIKYDRALTKKIWLSNNEGS
ncbi:sulfatase-like hydrolase/transferase [Ochrobactrum sp. MR28]|nr:sulfatase-like hydrolase/transferase [Ochrobactrum sp. MR28]MBX8815217.1 sulfatase-like hydrolase/transferase [Ochrobactrum sp. MR31]